MSRELSIITIAFEETKELIETYNSIKFLLQAGSKWILVINKPLKKFVPSKSTTVIEGKDKGMYDAINIGLNEVMTDCFMLLHSGDIISDSEAFSRSITYIQDGYDIILGGSEIGNRLHKSGYWKKWMLKFYVQPPHLPIIYKTQSCIKERYNIEISTVADFYYLKKLFRKKGVRYIHSGEVYIRMLQGGLTTSGLSSFIHVTISFIKVDGLTPLMISPIRFLLKLLLR